MRQAERVMRICIAFPLLFSALLFADDRNTVSGCVTDENGRPAVHLRVSAFREEGTTGFFSDKTEWKAETQPPGGCFQLAGLPAGTYTFRLADPRFPSRLEPSQGTVKVLSGDSKQIDLSSELPNARLLTDGLSSVVLDASTGFASQKLWQLTDKPTAGQYGGVPGWFVAQRLSGFHNCLIIPPDSPADPMLGIMWCKLKYIRRPEDAKVLFSRFQSIVQATISGLPSVHLDLLKEATCDEKDCFEKVRWRGPNKDVDVQLKLIREGKYDYGVELWVNSVKKTLQDAPTIRTIAPASGQKEVLMSSEPATGPASFTMPKTGEPREGPTITALSQLSNRTAWIESTITPFQRIVGAGNESVPFQSLKGEMRSDRKRWNVTILPPGAKDCFVGISPGIPPLDPWPVYFCVWQYSSDSDAKMCYENLIALIQQDGSWKTSSPGALDKNDVQVANYYTMGPQNELVLEVSRTRANLVAINLSAFVPKTRRP
jgi:Carboxypeptidase regulatory-like domain